MALELPPPIAGYFAADQSADAAAFSRLFSERAIVRDEGHIYAGRDAIHRWKTEATAKYRYTTQPLGVAEEGGLIVVTAQVAGGFPGSPIHLRYRFELDDYSIASLEIVA